MVKIITLVTVIIVILLMLGCEKKDKTDKMVKEEFKNEIKVEKLVKIYPLEPFKKREGEYLLILIDKIDKEEFSTNFSAEFNAEEIIEMIKKSREAKNNYLFAQKKTVEIFKKKFDENFIQMSALKDMHGNNDEKIKFFLDKNKIKNNNTEYLEELFNRIKLNVPDSYSKYIAFVDNPKKFEKGYYSYSEKGIHYLYNLSSFASSLDTDFYISKTKYNSPMYSSNPNLRVKFISLNDKISSQNYFFKNTGLFIEILGPFGLFQKIDEDLVKALINRNIYGDIVYGYLDKHDKNIGVRGIIEIMLKETVEEIDICEFFYDIEREQIILFNE